MMRILIVDDSPEDIIFLSEALTDQHQVTTAETAEEALDKVNADNTIELMLLDINLPGMNGYDACRTIREDDQHNHLDVIFVSANDDTEEIIEGLEVGAIDYITKPYDINILLQKINIAEKNRARQAQLSETIEEANKVAMNAISDTGDLGVVVSFLRESFSVSSYYSLANCIVEALQQLHLEASAYIKLDEEQAPILNTSNQLSELELELMRRLAGKKTSFLAKDERLFIVQRDIVVFIRNMPTDIEKAGRLKDYIMILLEGANEKLVSLAQVEQLETMRKRSVNQIVDNAKQALTNVQNEQQQCNSASLEALKLLVEEVQECMLTMGLTENQETEIMELLHNAHDSVYTHLVKGADVNKEVADIIDLLNVAG